ncbi:hypothetical protein GSI_14105 [Ganoderma sinense ZZ0214-1]|uniref:ABM domain-containing protein n=1 Tax=Ganoderma sinense ZZ0214-1 TaxID=1077348 RepID=A0A2G8RS67_9APHY|nr:hypothetical protein GSI_14105 [Ganoderma sinense ZZ0214-1]
MTVTEFATLKLVSPHTWASPDIQAFFRTLSTQQGAWSGYSLRFFADTTDPQLIYLITGWESVATHYEWIASEQNQALLERAEGMIEVEGLAHAELDSEKGDAQFVVWTQWMPREGESVAGQSGAGLVVDKEGPLAYSLQGYGSEKEAGDLGVTQGGQSRKTIGAYRLTLEC